MSKYRYRLERNYSLGVAELDGLLTEPFMHQWFDVDVDGTTTVHAGYAFDGASVVPDGPKMKPIPPDYPFIKCLKEGDYIRQTTRATLHHDCFYQFLELISDVVGKPRSYVRKAADDLFLEILREDGFRMALLYYYGVRFLGPPYHAVRKWFLWLIGKS
jgi:hypothetical protein